jgi:hypothetical protein
MTASRISALVALAVLALLVLPRTATSAPPPAPTASCSPGPSDCFSWHNSNVTLTWASPPTGVSVASGCGSVTITSDTGGTPVGCTWKRNATGETTGVTVSVRRDTAPPSVRGVAERAPDANGWYNRPVSVKFEGSDPLSGISSCTSGTYGGPDSTTARLGGTCSDGAGNTGSTAFELKYDATAPTVEGKPDRPANAKGWYNRAVTVAFVGTDAVAGIDACDPPVLYKGPNTDKATLSGACRDKASNQSQPATFDLKYDSVPPKLGKVRAEIGARTITLRWTASTDTSSVAVVRRPGLRDRKPSTLHNRRTTAFTDRRVKSGVKYRYTVTAYDEAGNGAVKVLVAQLGKAATSAVSGPAVKEPTATKPAAKPAVVRPLQGARLSSPPLMVWKPVGNADYYNLQLFRGGTKILSVWPSRPSFQLRGTWTFGKREFRLSPGRYVWYVWAGFGALSAHRYGPLLIKREFVVTR